MKERKLSIDMMPGDEVLLSGPARVSVARTTGRRVRVMVKADDSVTITRVVNER